MNVVRSHSALVSVYRKGCNWIYGNLTAHRLPFSLTSLTLHFSLNVSSLVLCLKYQINTRETQILITSFDFANNQIFNWRRTFFYRKGSKELRTLFKIDQYL